ncbi:CAMK family protein kinase [Histomonas meleagridis]|uniref:CAMK family protein kinase n=1 Tax=Histomonas meleagridis TaxID=135588 RepID=UPI00355AA223|nr:CAMK family protein kinase [Histomonas meleagridis]KAH0802188.1 CAMK family protein kinase [Histomonas meleagridis]
MSIQSIGAYKFIRFLNSGTFGGVWECKSITTGELVACKIVDIENCKNPEFLSHFKKELIIHSQIRHPSITQLLDVIVDKENIYIFIELCDGGDLNDAVMSAGGLPENQARHYFKQIMSAISYIHQLGIAHRDIKLENILVTSNGHAKLTDFGLCKQQNPGSLLLTTCGTLVYAAPEIIKEEPYDGMKADIWSAGIVLYAMVANHFPWASDESLPPERIVHETARQIISGSIILPEGISFELENLLFNMLNVDPNERPTADDILQHPWMEADDDNDDELELCNLEPDMGLVNMVQNMIQELDKIAGAP